jgi:hypothetical protein
LKKRSKKLLLLRLPRDPTRWREAYLNRQSFLVLFFKKEHLSTFDYLPQLLPWYGSLL